MFPISHAVCHKTTKQTNVHKLKGRRAWGRRADPGKRVANPREGWQTHGQGWPTIGLRKGNNHVKLSHQLKLINHRDMGTKKSVAIWPGP